MGQSALAGKNRAGPAVCGLLALFCLAAAPAGAGNMPPARRDLWRRHAMVWARGRGRRRRSAILPGYIHDRALHGANSVSEALAWYRLAAAQGEVRAQFRLGLLFDTDPRLPRDPDQAERWVRSRRGAGPCGGALHLARLIEAEDTPALQTSMRSRPRPASGRRPTIWRCSASMDRTKFTIRARPGAGRSGQWIWARRGPKTCGTAWRQPSTKRHTKAGPPTDPELRSGRYAGAAAPSASLRGRSAMIALRSASVILAQRAISESRRPHPRNTAFPARLGTPGHRDWR